MPVTYKLISTVTVSTATVATIDFQNIPATFDDLVIKLSARTNRASVVDTIYPRFNNDTTAGNYSVRRIYGSGSAAFADTAVDGGLIMTAANNQASTFGNGEMYLPNYTSSNNKSYSLDSANEDNQTTAYLGFNAGLWSSTAVINRITLYTEVGPAIVQYSTAYLYGIKKS